jgi:hypothetical protein
VRADAFRPDFVARLACIYEEKEIAMVYIDTKTLAQELHIRPDSIRSQVSRANSYHGIVPFKLPSGRLLWPANSVDLLIRRGSEPQAKA